MADPLDPRLVRSIDLLRAPNPLLQAPTLADAWSHNTNTLGDWMERERQVSRDRGLWTGGSVFDGGHPTPQGLLDVTQQYGNALLMGTTAPAARAIVLADGTIMAGGNAVGRMKYEHGDQMTRIADIQVNPSSQNQGLGTSAIRQIQQEAAERGNPVVLSTDAMRGKQAQADQRRLYERLGFVPNRGPGAVGERVGGRRVVEELVWMPPPTP